MTDKTLSYVLRNCATNKGIVVREEGDLKAILLKKRIREPLICLDGKRKTTSGIYECLVLTHKDKKFGIIVHFPNSDIHLFVFKKERGKGYMSQLVKDGFLKLLWPDINECQIVNMEEFSRIKHLLDISGFSVCKKSVVEYENYYLLTKE